MQKFFYTSGGYLRLLPWLIDTFMIVDGVLIMKTEFGLSRLLYRVFWVELSIGYWDTNSCGCGYELGIDL